MVCEITKNNAFAVLGQAVSSLEDGKTYTVEIKEKKEKRRATEWRSFQCRE